MTYLNAKKYIFNSPEQKNGDKDALNLILDKLGSPHKRLKYLRLVGNNAKTVCAEMLRSVLGCAGYTVGCLRLPLCEDPHNNICVGSSCISMSDFSVYISSVRELCTQCSVTLTRSELLLMTALLAFKNAGCDLCILECGDIIDTSVLPIPFAAVICGTIPSTDRSEISKIRSFICKGIEEIVSAPQDSAALKIIQDTCYSANCRLTLPSKNTQSLQKLNFRGSEFTYRNVTYTLKLCGRFQISNAVLVLETLEMLGRHGFRISTDSVKEGLNSLKIPAKFEVVSLSPLIIVDSTHSPVAIKTVCESLADFKADTGKRIVLCLPQGDIIDRYCEELTALGYEIYKIFTLPDSEHSVSDEHMSGTVVCKNARALLKNALSELNEDTLLLISGKHPFVTPVRYELLSTLGF